MHDNVKMILAVDAEGGVGRGGQLPWYDPVELRHFKNTTKGHIVVMGYNTFKSLELKPLPDRENIVLIDTSRMTSLQAVTIKVIKRRYPDLYFMSMDSFIKRYLHQPDPDSIYYIIGGAKTYAMLLPYCNEILLSQSPMVLDCDVKIDIHDWLEDFQLTGTPEPLDDSIFQFSVYRYIRRN